MARFDFDARRFALGVGVAILIVSAGCSSFLADGNPPSEGTTTEGPTATEGPTQQGTVTPSESNASSNSTNSSSLRASGDDLRSLTIPENDSEQNTYYGEIDGNDSVIEGTNQYYEPILFAAEAGDTINVSMSSIAHDPELRLRSPNGTTIAIDDDGGNGNDARFDLLELNQTGQYTLVAAAAEANTGFDYTLTVERYVEPQEPRYSGEPESWDEDSRYAEFAYDYMFSAQELSGGPENWSDADTPEETEGNLTAVNFTVNTEEDYVVVTYGMNANANASVRENLNDALLNAYWGLYESYTASDAELTNETWIPDRVYLRAIEYNSDLYRTGYIETDWAEYYSENRQSSDVAWGIYSALYYETERYGPAHGNYTEGGEDSITAGEFPEYYENVTATEEVGTDE